MSDPLRLLVITQSPGDARMIREVLREAGLPSEVVWRSRSRDALDALQGEPFDLLLLDPDPEVVAQAGERAPGTPIVLLVSRDDMETAVRALGRGADDHLVREDITPELLVCTVRHALTLKRMKTALERMGGMWREIVGNLHEGVMVADREGTTLFASARMAEILGYAAEEMLKAPFLSFVDPEDAPRAEALLGTAGRAEAEFRLRRFDGERVGVRLIVFPVTCGTAVGVMDIRERPAEEEIRRRNVQLSIINQVVRTATSSADMDELLTGVLGKTVNLLGFGGGSVYLIDSGRSRAELAAEIGLPEGFSFRQRIADMNAPPYDTVLGQGVPHFVEDYPRRYPQDAGAGIQAFASIPITAEGRVIGAVNLVSREVHTFSPGERELLTSIGQEIGSAVERMRLRKRLEKAHEEANFYLDVMTHDINNANTTAIGYAALLSEALSGPERDLARRISAAVRQSAEIIGNVSTIRRIAEEVPVPGPVSLDDVIGHVSCLFADADIRYAPQGLWVAADDLLSAVFINLVGNAVKFGGPQIVIQITAREEDGTVTVSVEDTGPGIPDAEKPLVFEKFRKSGARSGKGIGLYIVHTLVERYGGRVWVEDRVPGRPREGAAFRFTLPACPPVTGRTG